jgi:hypothetical protein
LDVRGGDLKKKGGGCDNSREKAEKLCSRERMTLGNNSTYDDREDDNF